ncbi:mitochondrial ribosomal death-associated protein 3-domain-containing protein [Amanita rubescens]|nr:mitochondrial ribosomal death-associated protein 3-domain-containing protein [Amanita rubescens]
MSILAGAFKGPPKVEKDDKGQVRKRKQKDGPGVFSTPAWVDTSKLLLRTPAFSPDALAPTAVGTMAFFAFSENDPVRRFGLPKKLLLEYRVLSRPYTVIRDVTMDVVDMLKTARDHSSMDSRHVLTGRSGAGKSYLLLQAVEYCAKSGWVVVYIPQAVNLVNSSQTYIQSPFAYQTLQRALSINISILSSLSTAKNTFLRKTRAMDDFQALYCKTAYRDPFFNPIRPYHLSMPRLIMEYASGRRFFEFILISAKGAVFVLGAITYSDPAYPLPLEQRHFKYLMITRRAHMTKYTKGLNPIPVPEKLSLDEAGSLFEEWKAEQVIAPSARDELFFPNTRY